MTTPQNAAARTTKDFIEPTLKMYEGLLKPGTLQDLENVLQFIGDNDATQVSSMDEDKIEEIANAMSVLKVGSKHYKDRSRRALKKLKAYYDKKYIVEPKLERAKTKMIGVEDILEEPAAAPFSQVITVKAGTRVILEIVAV